MRKKSRKIIKSSNRCGDWPIVRSLVKNEIVLDLGCGDGALSFPFQCVLLDISPERLKKGQSKPKIVGDIHNLPIKKLVFPRSF